MEYLIIGLALGYIIGNGGVKIPHKQKKKEVDLITEDKKRREQEHFEALMNYDVKQAYGVKR